MLDKGILRQKFSEEASISCLMCGFELSPKDFGLFRTTGQVNYCLSKWHWIDSLKGFVCPTCGFSLYQYFSQITSNPLID